MYLQCHSCYCPVHSCHFHRKLFYFIAYTTDKWWKLSIKSLTLVSCLTVCFSKNLQNVVWNFFISELQRHTLKKNYCCSVLTSQMQSLKVYKKTKGQDVLSSQPVVWKVKVHQGREHVWLDFDGVTNVVQWKF